jgi:hypothetical protein
MKEELTVLGPKLETKAKVSFTEFNYSLSTRYLAQIE